MNVKEFFNSLLHERPFRWYVLAGFSLIVSLAFATYNLIVGILFRLAWNFSVSFYYLFLVIIKGIILYREYKGRTLPRQEMDGKRLTLFTTSIIFLLLVDLALIAPIVLMLLQEKQTITMGTIPTITIAAYTTYKIVMACIGYRQSKKSDNLALYCLKTINLKEAIVSIITLQNTMVVAFGDESEMLLFTTWTTIGMFLSLLVISLWQFVKLYRLKKK